MRIPQVSERVKEAPAHALRAVFSRLGQVLLVTDRLKNRSAGPEQVPRPRTAGPDGTAVPAGQPSPAPAGSAPPAPAESAPPASAAEAPAAEAPAGETPVAAAPSAEAPVAESAAARTPPASSAAKSPAGKRPAAKSPSARKSPAAAPAEPPLPNYSDLSVASLRARMRGLTLEQVRELIEHERATAGREDVIAMFERRAAKLEAEAREG